LANRIPVCATAHKAEDRGPQHQGHCTRMQDSRYESRCVFIMAQLYIKRLMCGWSNAGLATCGRAWEPRWGSKRTFGELEHIL